MTDFTLSSLALTVGEGGIYSFSITPSAALKDAIKVRWEVVATGKLPISSGDFGALKGTVIFDSGAIAEQTISITPRDNTKLKIPKDFEIRIYQVTDADDSTSETVTDDFDIKVVKANVAPTLEVVVVDTTTPAVNVAPTLEVVVVDTTTPEVNVVPVLTVKPKLIDASDYTEVKIGDGSGDDRLGSKGTPSAQLIQGGDGRDWIKTSWVSEGDVVIGGAGNDSIQLNTYTTTADTVIHRFASSGTDWTNSDGADRIRNFQRGTDKLVFVDTDDTLITNLEDFRADLPASGIEVHVYSYGTTAQGVLDGKIGAVNIKFAASDNYLRIVFSTDYLDFFSGEILDANLITYASVSDSLEAVTGFRAYKVTDFAVLDDLFGEGSLDVVASADLGFTIL